jgi:hypothetical protein
LTEIKYKSLLGGLYIDFHMKELRNWEQMVG